MIISESTVREFPLLRPGDGLRRRAGRSEGVRSLLAVAVPEPENAARLHVSLVLRNHVERLGIEQMLLSLAAVESCQSHDDVAAALGDTTAWHESTVLVIALRDLDEVTGSLLRSATRRGMKLLVLIDDELTHLHRLAGVRSSGFASVSDLDATSLNLALERLGRGEMPIPPHVAHLLVSVASEQYDAGASRTRVRVTPREQEVLVLLVEGLSNKQIARRLGISVHGAKRHVANVLAKLDCPNRTLAVARALREGLYEEYLAQAGQQSTTTPVR